MVHSVRVMAVLVSFWTYAFSEASYSEHFVTIYRAAEIVWLCDLSMI